VSRARAAPPAKLPPAHGPDASSDADPLVRGFAPRLLAWQKTHGRHDLPWQGSTDPYRVWLSEVMLQQTQVTTVMAYYARFLQRFPDVQSLAAAPQDDVLALWSGLGYYSRARNLHACAVAVVQQHGGKFPEKAEVLATLPGIGRSTAAAIAAFCFHERVTILDGNVRRVLSRFFGVQDDLSQARNERALWARATALLPERPADMPAYTQGLMDLGATCCTPRSPRCEACPMSPDCVARREGDPSCYPVKTRRTARRSREDLWLWVAHRDRLWLQQRPARGVWAGLWSVPLVADEAAWSALTQGWPGNVQAEPSFVHVLTHLDWRLHPRRWTLPAGLSAARLAAIEAALGSGRWFTREEALAAGLPAPLRRWILGAGS
jgi:A/G-specific adenine glycosylase